jgi:hypothetical protein
VHGRHSGGPRAADRAAGHARRRRGRDRAGVDELQRHVLHPPRDGGGPARRRGRADLAPQRHSVRHGRAAARHRRSRRRPRPPAGLRRRYRRAGDLERRLCRRPHDLDVRRRSARAGWRDGGRTRRRAGAARPRVPGRAGARTGDRRVGCHARARHRPGAGGVRGPGRTHRLAGVVRPRRRHVGRAHRRRPYSERVARRPPARTRPVGSGHVRRWAGRVARCDHHRTGGRGPACSGCWWPRSSC